MEKTGSEIVDILTVFSCLAVILLFLFMTYLLFLGARRFFKRNRSVYINKSMKIRSPGLSAVLSLIIPGLGQIKNSEILRGLTYLTTCAILSSLIFFAYLLKQSEYKIIATGFGVIFMVLLLYVYIDSIRDAYKAALIIKKKIEPARKIEKAVSSENASDIVKKGRTLYGSGNYQAAIDSFSKAIDLDPGYGTAYYNRGVAYYKLSNFLEAGKDFIAAAKLGHAKAQNVLKSEGVSF